MTKKLLLLTLILGSLCNVLLPEANLEKIEPKLKRSRRIKVDNAFKKQVARFAGTHDEKTTEASFTSHEKDGKNNYRHGYPQLPSDLCNCDVEEFKEQYQDAIDRDMNDALTTYPNYIGLTWPLHIAECKERGLKFRLYQIKQAQQQCPKYQDKKFVKELMLILEQ